MMITQFVDYNNCKVSPGMYVPSTNAVCVPSNPFTLKQYSFEKKPEGRSNDTTFESNDIVILMVKEPSQPSCCEPYSIWQNVVCDC